MTMRITDVVMIYRYWHEIWTEKWSIVDRNYFNAKIYIGKIRLLAG